MSRRQESAPRSPEKQDPATASAPLTITYPADLPVSQRRDDIMAAIRDKQVVVVAGATGSGKTTQLPKMLLELGYGRPGRLIGHTQPRRIAARSVAQRIASELGERLGEGTVGYQVRFTKETSRGTRLKLMTDGILLAEIQRDRLLRRYDAIIIDSLPTEDNVAEIRVLLAEVVRHLKPVAVSDRALGAAHQLGLDTDIAGVLTVEESSRAVTDISEALTGHRVWHRS